MHPHLQHFALALRETVAPRRMQRPGQEKGSRVSTDCQTLTAASLAPPEPNPKAR